MPTPKAEGPTDASLVAGARAGDRDAFAALVARWQRPLFARALRNVRNLEDADDLVQETFLRAWQGLEGFRDDQRFGAWALRILVNLAIDRGRVAGREVATGPGVAANGEGGSDDGWSLVPDTRPGPEDTLLAGELAGAVRGALAAIPPGRKREVFRMRFIEGRPIQDIADALGVHGGTVKVHLFRLARDLRRHIAGGGRD